MWMVDGWMNAHPPSSLPAYLPTYLPICMAIFSPNCGTMTRTSTPSESMVQTPKTDMSSPRVTYGGVLMDACV